jgi:hypothetical protein
VQNETHQKKFATKGEAAGREQYRAPVAGRKGSLTPVKAKCMVCVTVFPENGSNAS